MWLGSSTLPLLIRMVNIRKVGIELGDFNELRLRVCQMKSNWANLKSGFGK